MGKKIIINKSKTQPEEATDWIESRDVIKRLTFDVTLSLHKRLKYESVRSSQTMGDIVRNCLEEYLLKQEKRK
tara:strand:- start:543 stop:761 length:219 start_codon:yes stop_codon:yes gene_type:complete